MPITRFTGPLAVVLSLCTLTDAWALYHKADKKDARKETQPELRRHEAQALNLEKRDVVSLYCPDDNYRQFLDNNPPSNVQTVCNQLLGLSPTTETVDYTPTV
jgi:hypothetical protein